METKKITLEDLAIDHPYYASRSNYFSNDCFEQFDCFADFLEEYKDADIDYNLIYRWDLDQITDSNDAPLYGRYSMWVYFIRQRKGIYAPCEIQNFEEKDVEPFLKFIQKHFDYMMEIWKPISH